MRMMTHNPQRQTSNLQVRIPSSKRKYTHTSNAKTSATPSRDFHVPISPKDQRDLALSIEATTWIGFFVERELKHCEIVCDTLSRSAVEWILGRTKVWIVGTLSCKIKGFLKGWIAIYFRRNRTHNRRDVLLEERCIDAVYSDRDFRWLWIFSVWVFLRWLWAPKQEKELFYSTHPKKTN